jgi:hypothetical protein
MVSLQRERDRLMNDNTRLVERIKQVEIDLTNANRKIVAFENEVRLHYSFSDSPVPDIPLLADRRRGGVRIAKGQVEGFRHDYGALPVRAQGDREAAELRRDFGSDGDRAALGGGGQGVIPEKRDPAAVG